MDSEKVISILDGKFNNSSDVFPLLSFILIAYNQENYIREAVEGAFNQTYYPLEIFLSDDCSSDDTFLIMKDMAQSYQGRNTVILNRNEENLGIGAHISSLAKRAKGEIIIIAAGDDISIPERSSIIYEFSRKLSSDILIFTSDFIKINEGSLFSKMQSRQYLGNEKISLENIINGEYKIHGALAAYRNKLFHEFPVISRNIINEDIVLLFRASLLSGYVFRIPEYLVKVRPGGINSNNGEFRVYRLIQLERYSNLLDQWMSDLVFLGEEKHQYVIPLIDQLIYKTKIRIQFIENKFDLNKFILLIKNKPKYLFYMIQDLFYVLQKYLLTK